MANPHRGEIDAELGGRSWTLCLTLGALAELEAAYGDEDLLAIVARFEQGRFGATDLIRLLGAGLRGAGHEISDKDVAEMKTPGGAPDFVNVAARLLRATFAQAEAERERSEDAPAPGK